MIILKTLRRGVGTVKIFLGRFRMGLPLNLPLPPLPGFLGRKIKRKK
jgi:hypothetical protein